MATGQSSKARKICMVAYTFYETDNRVRRYAEALVKCGDSVDAFALRREGQKAFEIIRGVHVHRIQGRLRNEKRPISYFFKLVAFFFRSAWAMTIGHLRKPYDLIHVHSVPDVEVFATLIPKLLGAKVILDIHDIVPEFYASKFRVSESSAVFRMLVLTERLSSGYADHVIIANHLWHKKITGRSVRPAKCTALINYPDLSIFSNRNGSRSADGQFVICYPGTLNWHQGLDLAIEAVALLRDRAPNLRFRIVGDGPERESLRALIAKHRLEDRVSMEGSVPLEQVAEIMSSTDLGVVPKRGNSFGNEAFSTKIMEFMAMSVPVVAARTRIDEYYFDGNLVQFFEPGNSEDLAGRIYEMLSDRDRRAELIRNCSAFIAENSWDVRKQEYLTLVDNLVG